jgi:hypothetical protein
MRGIRLVYTHTFAVASLPSQRSDPITYLDSHAPKARKRRAGFECIVPDSSRGHDFGSIPILSFTAETIRWVHPR